MADGPTLDDLIDFVGGATAGVLGGDFTAPTPKKSNITMGNVNVLGSDPSVQHVTVDGPQGFGRYVLNPDATLGAFLGASSEPDEPGTATLNGPEGFGKYILDGPGGTPGTFLGDTRAPPRGSGPSDPSQVGSNWTIQTIPGVGVVRINKVTGEQQMVAGPQPAGNTILQTGGGGARAIDASGNIVWEIPPIEDPAGPLAKVARQGELAEQFANVISNPDPTALRAFLTAGGGNLFNALQGGNTAVSDLANLPAAQTLRAISDLRGDPVRPPGPATAPSSTPPPPIAQTGQPTATSSVGPVVNAPSAVESEGAHAPRQTFAQHAAQDRAARAVSASRQGLRSSPTRAPQPVRRSAPPPPVSLANDNRQNDVNQAPPAVDTSVSIPGGLTPNSNTIPILPTTAPAFESSSPGVGTAPTPPPVTAQPANDSGFVVNEGQVSEAITPEDRPFLNTVADLRASAEPGARDAVRRLNLLDFFAQSPTIQASDIAQIGTAFGIPEDDVRFFLNRTRLRGQGQEGSRVVGL